MKLIDRLIMKAAKIKPVYEGLYIISNATGKWMIGNTEFSSLEDVEKYVDDQTEDQEDVFVIINDLGEPPEGGNIPGRVYPDAAFMEGRGS